MSSPTIRIQKWLSQNGISSRRLAEEWIRQKRIKVNNKTIVDLGFKIDPVNDRVKLDNKLIKPSTEKEETIILNKPLRCLTSRVDPRERRTIYDLADLKTKNFILKPVGRLDYHTSGLLLLSSCGELVHRLMHPSYEVERVYHVRTQRPLSGNEILSIQSNKIKLSDGLVICSNFAEIKSSKYSNKVGYWYEISLKEGRNRLVRRLFTHFDVKVMELIRTQFAGIVLPVGLAKGKALPLSKSQLSGLLDQIGLKKD